MVTEQVRQQDWPASKPLLDVANVLMWRVALRNKLLPEDPFFSRIHFA